jgi:hypothetical protein
VSVGASGVQGKGSSVAPALSAGGCFVAFSCLADDLVRGGSNGAFELFVRAR